MQARKLLALGASMLITLGCDGFFATDTLPMDCRVLGCPPGELCKPKPRGLAVCEEGPTTLEEEEEQEGQGKEGCKEDSDCAVGRICEFWGNTRQCILGERPNENLGPTLHSFQLLQKVSPNPTQVIIPYRVDGGAPNPNAGWIDKSSAVLMHMVVQGPDADKDLVLQRNHAAVPCQQVADPCNAERCAWVCPMLPPWQGSELVLHLKLGHQGERVHSWVYLIGPPSIPEVSFEAVGKAVLGGRLVLCTWLPKTFELSMHAGSLRQGNQEVSLTWSFAQAPTPLKACQSAPLPLSFQNGAAQLTVSGKVNNAEGEEGSFNQQLPLALTRTECSRTLTVDGAVTEPLAFVNGRLALGAGAYFYLLDVATCESANSLHSLHTGPVQGPMVVLGDSAQVAVATSVGGVADREMPRLLLVNAAAAPAVFAQTPAEDCTIATHFPAATSFTQGLSLLSLENPLAGTPWRLAAPANDIHSTQKDQSCLLAYTPWASTSAARCVRSASIPQPLLTPMAHRANGQVAGVYYAAYPQSGYGEQIREWSFNGTWTALAPQAKPILSNPSFLSIADHPTPGMDDFIRAGHPALSAAAIDSQNRAYEVLRNQDFSWQLRRTALGGTQTLLSSSLFYEMPVGSPLLGEPMGSNPTEVYVVTTHGTLRAFGAESLQLLWTESLGFEVSERAQPVLVANADGNGTLWVVGKQGEVRGIRVASRGLNRLARWPKALRDNCNTSSRQVTYALMPSCF